MVHKRYVKKRGKTFGPYYYESYRDGDKVKKRYIGREKEYKELIEADRIKKKEVEKNLKEFKVSRKKSEIIGKFLQDNIFKGALGKKPKSTVLVEQPLKPLFSERQDRALPFNLNRKLFIFIFLAVLFIIVINANFSLVGYVVGYDEEIKESYNKEVELEIKKPVKVFGESISSNENERMDFKINGGLRLYFELLNYTNYVGEIGKKIKEEKEEKKEEKQEEKIEEKKEKIVNQTIEVNESYKEVEENRTIIELVNKTDDKEIENKTELKEEERIGENEIIEEVEKKKEINDTETEKIINETINETKSEDVVQLPQEGQEKEEKIEEQEEIKKEEETEKQEEKEVEKKEVKDSEEKVEEEQTESESEAGITGNVIRFFGLIGRVIGIEFNETELNESVQETKNISPLLEVNITLQEIKERAENLTQEEIKIIEDNSVATSDEFEIVINDTLARDSGVDYKWGYKVKLNDEKFIARIDVTSNNSITQYDDYVLQIGRSLLSFKDLVEQGYDVKFEKPELMEEILVEKEEINDTKIELVNKTEIENKTELKEEEIGENETIEEVEKEKEINDTEVERIANDTEIKDVVQLPQEKEVKKSEEKVEEVEKVKGESEKEEVKEEKIKEEQKKIEEQVAEQTGITGNIVKTITGFFTKTTASILGITARVIGIDSEIEDIYYENTVSVYIERDFSEYIKRENENNKENKKIPSLISGVHYLDIDNSSSLSLGDILILDPSLIIIPITKAEHLDENRSFISDIYNWVKEKDDNWSEIINNSHYVRVTFEQALGKTNDITVFARAAGINETGEIEVYKQDRNEIIARIENITSANWYKTYLDGLHGGAGLGENETTDVFDLKIVKGILAINNFVMINGNEVPYDIYQKKKRIDELRRLLNQS